MESTGYRHIRSTSSDRFLGLFSSTLSSSAASSGGGEDELNEAEIFWTADFTEPIHSNSNHNHHRRLNFHQQTGSGILSVLPEADHLSFRTLHDGPVLCRKPSTASSSSSKAIPLIPRPPEREYCEPIQGRNFHHLRNNHQSAPMKVPVLSQAMAKRRKEQLEDVDVGDGDEAEMLPPHEIVARGSGVSPKTTFSVLEGVGRTLKGRDLRQVRNAIWRKTGFLD
ncbi:hypothetical protein F2P56_005841 [Juglans regia]|uniref:Senescence regulator S40 n=2 Tax=Juglans regia TaxID=51240 RepID=A0A834D198_JUGRE|nr:uncharacterized protein LOC109012194 [Juglans regia]KAF5473890.1 hypothetical protein F2P56_005841 [Juglans regia]